MYKSYQCLPEYYNYAAESIVYFHLTTQVHSFWGLSASEAHYRLENYFKAVVIRNPKVRVVSAYRNKIETPFELKNRAEFPNDIKQHILQMYSRKSFEQWLWYDRLSDIHPTFGDYVRWLSAYPHSMYNEHFKSVTETCFPCAINYDIYLNFKTYDYDLYALMDYLDIPRTYYPRVIAHPEHSTSEYVAEYLGQLSDEERDMLRERLRIDIDFYYSLYPEEKGVDAPL